MIPSWFSYGSWSVKVCSSLTGPILHRAVVVVLLYQGTMEPGVHLRIHSTISGNSRVRPNRTVYSGVMLLYWRYAVHSPEVQAFTSNPSSFQTRPKPKLIGIVVEVPWCKLIFHVESADFTYQPRPRLYEMSG